jgi:hypothetical protein
MSQSLRGVGVGSCIIMTYTIALMLDVSLSVQR